jgi:hypothetical protein
MESTKAPVIRWGATTRRRHELLGGALRGVAPLLPRRPIPREPVFIIGSPRSGTTMLFNLLDRSPRLASLGKGSQLLWEMFHKDRGPAWTSHAVGAGSISDHERRVLYWLIDRLAGDTRYLDKFPRNCLRVSYLHELFPEASFVYIRRDGRSVVSSLMTGWRTADKFGHGTLLPVGLSIDGYEGRPWRFLIPPGWEDYTSGRTLAEVCAFQWVAANEAILAAKNEIETKRWVDVSYEELLESPRQATSKMFAGIGLPVDDEVLTWASELETHVSRTAVTVPSHDKWRKEHPNEVQSILPLIEPMMRRLGYDVGASTSRVTETGPRS